MPGSYFQVVGQINDSPSEIAIIRLKEIPPPITLMKSLLSTSNNNSSSTLILEEKILLKSDHKWKQSGITVAGGNGEGNELNQFSGILGIFIDDDQTILVADQWKSNTNSGQIIMGGHRNETNQLNNPIDIIIDKENDSFIIADSDNRRIIQWSRQNNTTNGQILIDGIDCWGLAMDKDGSFYVSDYLNNEVRQWKRGEKTGRIVAGGHGKGNHLNQLNYPTFIFVDQNYSLYISDAENHRVMKWEKDAKKRNCCCWWKWKKK